MKNPIKYTLDQRIAAMQRGELWWRFHVDGRPDLSVWTRVSEDISDPIADDADDDCADYYIGESEPNF